MKVPGIELVVKRPSEANAHKVGSEEDVDNVVRGEGLLQEQRAASYSFRRRSQRSCGTDPEYRQVKQEQ